MAKKSDDTWKKWLIVGVPLLGVLAIAPRLVSGYYLSLLALIGIFTIIASGLNVLTGMTGLVSLGHAGLFAVGAYFAALADVDYGIPYWFSLPLGIVMAALVGGLLALTTLRVTGIYLAMITIAFGMIIRDVLLQWTWFSKGPWGITKIPPPKFGSFVFSPAQKYYLIVLLTILVLIAIRNLRESRWGRAFIAVRESPIAAASLGVNAYRTQTLAFTISAALAGLGGAIYAHQESVISPDLFTFDASLLFLIIVILGGLGSTLGPLIGGAFLLTLPEMLHGFEDYRLIVYGSAILICLYFMPLGVSGLWEEFMESRRQKQPQVNMVGNFQPRFSDPPNEVELSVKNSQAEKKEKSVLINLEGVTVTFGGVRAIDNVSLSVRENTIHALIGPNGAGKTTLINVISGIYRPASGEVNFRGQNIALLKSHEIAQHGIGRTFQHTQLFGEMSVLDNILIGSHLGLRENLWESMGHWPSLLSKEEKAKRHAEGLLDFVGYSGSPMEKAKNLAFGHQRIVEIARALALRPKLLLLDEPAAGLSAEEMGALADLIGKIRNQGVTILLIEHHMDLVMGISDGILVLNYGKKIAEGSPAEIQSNKAVIQAYLGED